MTAEYMREVVRRWVTEDVSVACLCPACYKAVQYENESQRAEHCMCEETPPVLREDLERALGLMDRSLIGRSEDTKIVQRIVRDIEKTPVAWPIGSPV